MLKLVPEQTKINFLGLRKICLLVSVLLLVGTLGGLFTQGLNYGIDFSGGTLVQIQTEQQPEAALIRAKLKQAGLEGLSIQEFGAADEFLIRTPGNDHNNQQLIVQSIVTQLKPVAGNVEVRRVEFVGPQIGEELRQKGLLAILLSLVAILIYISFRFEFRYAVGAVAALSHDVLLTVGVFVLTQKEVTLPVLAAMLTIIGYSLNDTIVVFDRVRENRRRYKKKPIEDVLNLSVNDMLGRTLMTSLTTLAVLLALFMLGGSVIHDFAFTLMFGVIVGTYSSIYIAAPVVLAMERYYRQAGAPVDDANGDVPGKKAA